MNEEEAVRLLAAGKKTNLNETDKVNLRRILSAYAENYQAPEKPAKLRGVRAKSWNLFSVSPLRPRLMTLALLTAGVVFTGSTVSQASEQATPGDLLYPIKKSVNERVKALLARTVEARGALHVELAHRRLTEAENLARRGRLSIKDRDDLESQFKRESDRAYTLIDQLEKEGKKQEAFELNNRLTAPLNVHTRILDVLLSREKKQVAGKKEIEPLLAQVQSASRVNQNKRSAGEGSISSDSLKAIVGEKLASIRLKLAESNAAIRAHAKDLSPSVNAALEYELNTARRLLDEAKKDVESGRYSSGFVRMHASLVVAQETQLLLKAHLDSYIDLSEIASGREGGLGIVRVLPTATSSPESSQATLVDLATTTTDTVVSKDPQVSTSTER